MDKLLARQKLKPKKQKIAQQSTEHARMCYQQSGALQVVDAISCQLRHSLTTVTSRVPRSSFALLPSLCSPLFRPPHFDAMAQLTNGAISRIYTTRDATGEPTVQVIDLKQLTSANAQPDAKKRYRLSLSDGSHALAAMVATQLNRIIESDELKTNTILRLKEFICNEVAGKRIIIVLGVEILDNSQGLIGSPVKAEKLDEPTAAPAATAAAGTSPRPVHKYQAAAETAPPSSGGFRGPGVGGGGWSAPPPAKKQAGVSPVGIIPGRSGGAMRFRDIQTINPYQTGWTIKGRCTFKSDVRTFTNARGEGKLMSFELTDNSGSIRVTCFTDLVDTIEGLVQSGHVYTVQRGQLKPANERYNKSTSSFEMTLGRESVVTELDDDGSVAQIKYNFTKVADLERIEVKGSCDVVGIVQHVGELSEITMRSTGDQINKRSITIMDDSNASVELTLWRTQAEQLLTEQDAERAPVIVLRGASRGDFGGVCLNVQRSTTIELDPVSIPEANALRGWFDAGGKGAAVQALTAGKGGGGGMVLGDRKSLEEAELEDVVPGMASGGGNVAFVARGYVSFIKKDKELSYPSDPDTKKKVTETGAPGMWHSESSGRELSEDEVVHRYIASMKVADFSGTQWVTAFDEAAVAIIGRSAGEMRSLFHTDMSLYESILDDCFFRPIVMKMSVREDTWQGESRMRYTVNRVEKANFVSESRALLSEIAQYNL